jgi:hypothetical protein
VWEAQADTTSPPPAYAQSLADHFRAPEQGSRDAIAAFTCAAEVIHQPFRTPVYFAVDFPAGDPDYQGAPMASLAEVVAYFQDVHRGYREYVRAHPEARYYVGAYAQADVCAALYRAGLATHFWQPWPPNWQVTPPFWRDNWLPFPHANAWQVVLENTEPHPHFPNMNAENAAVMACTSVDIDVAWGDPGAFQVHIP